MLSGDLELSRWKPPKPSVKPSWYDKTCPNSLANKKTQSVSKRFEFIWKLRDFKLIPHFPYKNRVRVAAKKQNAPQIFLVMVTHQQGRDDLCLHVEFRDSLCRQTQLVWLLCKNCYLENKKTSRVGVFWEAIKKIGGAPLIFTNFEAQDHGSGSKFRHLFHLG